jgi:RimJ/RimL family protein N-acetyltransferase
MAAIDPPTLSDGEITVRRVTEDLLDEVFEACQDEQIQRYTPVPSPYHRADARRWMEMSREGFEQGTGAHMAVVDAATGRLLGACGVGVKRGDRAAEIGYWVAPWARGRGVATAAVRLVCRWAFSELGIGRINLRASTENAASNAVAERAGFTLEGTMRSGGVLGHRGDPDAPRIDVNLYGLLPGELR